jgi:uncharacterized protein
MSSTGTGWLPTLEVLAREAALAEDRRRVFGSATTERLPAFAYRWEHVQQVVRNGRWLLTQVQADAEVVMAACWLHDVKKGEPDHARQGAAFARTFLPTTDFPPEKIEAVAGAIALHEGLIRPAADWNRDAGTPFRAAPPLEPIEAALLWDADKLSKIGPLAFLHFLPTHTLDLHISGEGHITTEKTVSLAQGWMDRIDRPMLASFNTLAAQRKAMELHAAYEVFWGAAAEAISLGLEVE